MSNLQASVFQLAFRGDTADRWASFNPVLAAREFVLETDTNQFKIGNGVTPYNDLPYGGLQGPPGDPVSPLQFLGDVATESQLVAQFPNAQSGQAAFVVDTQTLYIFTDEEGWINVGEAQLVPGPVGPTGPTGPVSTEPGQLGPTGPTGPQGLPSNVQGPTGAVGPTGPQGVSINLIGELVSELLLPVTGNPGDAYIIDGDVFVWNPIAEDWINAGRIVGPTGPEGDLGPTGPASTELGPTGPIGAQGPTGPAGPTGEASDVEGPTGPVGPTGPAGDGTASGGEENQILEKASSADFDTRWTHVPTVKGLQLDTADPADPAAGRIVWNDGDEVPQFVSNGKTVNISLETLARCRNVTGSLIPKGRAVCIVGASANRISIAPSDRTQPGSACRTLGLTTEDIDHNSFGKVSTFGLVGGLNTSNFNEGDELFVGETPGTLTTTEPDAPARRLVVGYVVTSNPAQGKIFVTLRRGVRVSEIDDVQLSTLSQGDVLLYNSITERFENEQIGAGAVGLDQVTNDAQLKIASNLADLDSVEAALINLNLNNVDNVADADKPVSTAQQVAIDTAIANHEAAENPHPQYKAQHFNFTIEDTDWEGSSPTYADITVIGILDTDKPIVDLDLSNTDFEDVADIQTAWSNVYRVESKEDELSFYSTADIEINLPVQVKVVR